MQAEAVNARVRIISAEQLYPAAEELCREIPALTASQISGLKNIARCAPAPKEIQDYISHQREKSGGMIGEKGLVVEKYWDGIIKKLRAITGMAKEEGEKMALDKKGKVDLELALMREFIYHLAAEQRFRLKR